MNAMLAFATTALLVCSAPLYGQTCSGGTAGGMNATGCECNTPPEDDSAESAFRRGIGEYESARYADAMVQLQRAAELGDVRAAEILALMYRYGERLYGDQVRADAAKAAHFAALAARFREMSRTEASAVKR
jgi:hypothetical protein